MNKVIIQIYQILILLKVSSNVVKNNYFLVK